MILYLIIAETLPKGTSLKSCPPPDVWEIFYAGNHPRHGKEMLKPQDLQSKCEEILNSVIQDYQECNEQSTKKSVVKTTFLDSNKDFRGCTAILVDAVQFRVTWQVRVMGD